MKNLILSVAIVTLVAPAAFAAGSSQSKPAKPSASSAQTTPAKSTKSTKPASKTHVVNAEFVRYDASSKTVTLKDDKGQTSSAPVEGKAISAVAHLKANEKVKVTCRDNANGEHQAVTDIHAVKSKA